MGNPYTKDHAQFGVRAAAAFVMAESMERANEACEKAIAAEDARHAREYQRIHAGFQFAASTALSTYHRTLEATQGDDDEMGDED